MIHNLFTPVLQWYMANITYGTVTVLMAIESSFIPFPSEIVVPPAAWKAAQGEMSVVGIFIASTVGALIGALINYYIAFFLGRKVIYSLAATRWAKVLLISQENVEKAEGYFNKYGRSSTFIGRLVPAVRQLISIPAGIARMKLPTFLLFTAIGSGLWNAILIGLGYFLGSQKDLLEKYYGYLKYGLYGLGALFILFIVYKIQRSTAKKRAA